MRKNTPASIITQLALYVAMVTIATMIHIPVGSRVYFNFGDVVILSIALLYGKKAGFICGSLGSAIADIILGYPLWAPFTFVIKGAEGFLTGFFGEKGKRILGLLVGGSAMVTGYTLSAGIIYGWKVAPIELTNDMVQISVGIIGAFLITKALETKIKPSTKNETS